ncbi:PE family protein [Mycobacterium riyadhense]|uniref:PE family protein n=1 Tax=Mycobacterium riyadhense TaxID=486698 RepID=UPI001EF9E8FC
MAHPRQTRSGTPKPGPLNQQRPSAGQDEVSAAIAGLFSEHGARLSGVGGAGGGVS